jgi:hypothetical protein
VKGLETTADRRWIERLQTHSWTGEEKRQADLNVFEYLILKIKFQANPEVYVKIHFGPKPHFTV